MKNGDNETVAAYKAAEPDSLGNLHQRMKAVMGFAHEAFFRKELPLEVPGLHKLWHAIWDLETEVKYYVPEEPPYGRRPVEW